MVLYKGIPGKQMAHSNHNNLRKFNKDLFAKVWAWCREITRAVGSSQNLVLERLSLKK